MNYKKIEGYDNYMVSDTGNVLNIKKNKNLVNVITDRYMIVLLYKNNKRKRYYVHRLVASAFCEKKEGKNYVNHKDLDRHNNNASNLEWVSSSENRIHFILSNKYTPSNQTKEQKKAIRERLYKKVLCLETNILFKSMGHYAKHKNISLSQVSMKLNNVCINNLNAKFYD
jgi:hypothetical protein